MRLSTLPALLAVCHLLPIGASALITVGALDTPGYARDVELVGDLAYVADGVSGLRVIDVSNPALPVEVGALDTLGYALDVEVLGDLAYVADYDSGLRIIDVSNPALPVEIGALDTPGSALDVGVVGDLVYLAEGGYEPGDFDGLRIIDVSDPAFPVEIGALDTPGRAYEVEVVGDLAYVADGPYGLRVIDVSNPAFPVEIGTLETPQWALDVEVVGDLAYVIDGGSPIVLVVGDRSLLRIVDVSDPAFPMEIGALSTPGAEQDVEVVGDLAYVAAGSAGLHAIDASDPAFPVEIGALDTPGFAGDVEVVGNLAYVADGSSGLRIIDFGPEYAQTITIDIDIKPGIDPNTINPSAGGVVPVAILGSDIFDVLDVDVTTLAFGPDGAAPVHAGGGHLKDVNGDGLMDLVSHYRIDETGITAGDEEVYVRAVTLDGQPIAGFDTIVTVPYVGERRRVRVNRQR